MITVVTELLTFRKAQLLCDGTGDLRCSGVTIQIHLIRAVPVHMTVAQLQAVNGCTVTRHFTFISLQWIKHAVHKEEVQYHRTAGSVAS